MTALRSDTQQKRSAPVRILSCFNSQRHHRGSINDSLQDGEAPRGQARYSSCDKCFVTRPNTRWTRDPQHANRQEPSTGNSTDEQMKNLHADGTHTVKKKKNISKMVATIQRWKERPHVAQQTRRCSTFRKTIPRSPPTSHRSLAWLLDANHNS